MSVSCDPGKYYAKTKKFKVILERWRLPVPISFGLLYLHDNSNTGMLPQVILYPLHLKR